VLLRGPAAYLYGATHAVIASSGGVVCGSGSVAVACPGSGNGSDTGSGSGAGSGSGSGYSVTVALEYVNMRTVRFAAPRWWPGVVNETVQWLWLWLLWLLWLWRGRQWQWRVGSHAVGTARGSRVDGYNCHPATANGWAVGGA
jgi:hypothetical protein